MLKNKWFKKVLWIALLTLVLSPLLFINPTNSQVQPYYSGDAVYYQNKVIFGSTDTGYLELFKFDGKNIVRILKLKNYNPIMNDYEQFSSFKFSLENNNLYVYTVSQYTVYKYDFSNLNNLVFVDQQKNTYWDWYDRVDGFGNNIGLISKNGVKIITPNLQIINSLNFKPSEKYGLHGHYTNEYSFAIDNSKIQVFDNLNQVVIEEIALNFKFPNQNHRIFFDPIKKEIYAVDDYYAKKFSFDGQLLSSFRHLDAPGYDMESSYGNPYAYFSNGFGVVKMNKDNFTMNDYAFTTTLGGPQGWAMGLKLVNTPTGDVLVIFNSSNILLLDKNLDKLAAIRSEGVTTPQVQEGLFLNLSQFSGAPGDVITLSGGGYWPNENLKVSFGSQLSNIQADSQGRFSLGLTVPSLSPQRVDVKVEGTDSSLRYSISFEIK